MDEVKNCQEVILAVDPKVKVGCKVENRIAGPFEEEITNETCESLNMCKTYNLKVTNTFFALEISTNVHGRDLHYIKINNRLHNH